MDRVKAVERLTILKNLVMRYTIYFYKLNQEWFVWDNQTNCMISGTGTDDKEEAENIAYEFNNPPPAQRDDSLDRLQDQQNTVIAE